ncbi:kelch-like protein 3 [Lineus longissimus]|uniref:kelch-like protein 3 n=1 Tax=Lineus longissimus TaxID=88925 RepID=UPI00315CAB2E
MFFGEDCFYDSDDPYYGGSYSSDDYESPRGIRLARSTYIKDGRVHSGDHADTFRTRLHDMFLSSDYCDVTLVTSKTTFKVHKVVLAANSAYFNAMFSSTCSEALHSVVSFKDNPSVTSTGLSAIIEYAYLGSFDITHSSVREILEVARHLLMEDVTKSCEKFIEDITIKLDNYVGLFETARDFGLTGVVKRIERFLECNEVNMDNYFEMIDFAIASNSDSVLEKVTAFISQELHYLMFSDELLVIMDPKIFIAVVKADRHGISTDMTLINFILKWVETSPKDRLPVLSNVIKEINLLCFEMENLDEIANLPFFKEDEKVKERIFEAKRFLLESKGRSTEDDLYVFGVSGLDAVFYSIASDTVITKKRVLQIPSHKNRFRQVTICSSSVIAVSDILFLIGEPTVQAFGEYECHCFSYDPARNVWKEHASLPSHREGYTLVSSDGEVYAIGGKGHYKESNRVDVYDFTRDNWRTGTPLPRSLRFFTSAAFNDSIYVYGHGVGDSSAYKYMYMYDRQSGRWAVKQSPMDYPGRYSTCTFEFGHLVAGGKGLYLITQVSAVQCLYRDHLPALGVQFYDQTSNQWEYSTLYHAIDDFRIDVVLSHKDDMYITGRYTKKDAADHGYWSRSPALFRFNEAAGTIELLKDNLPHDHVELKALVSIPKASIAWLAES